MRSIKGFISSLLIALFSSIFPGTALFFVIWIIGELFNLSSTTLKISLCVTWGIAFLYILYSLGYDKSEYTSLKSEIASLNQKIDTERKDIREKLYAVKLKEQENAYQQQQLDASSKSLDEREATLLKREIIVNEKETALYHDLPWFAYVFADYHYIQDKQSAEYLRTKSHPAYTASEKVAAIAKEKRELQVRCKLYEYQFEYLDSLFPWLEEFRNLDPKEGTKYLMGADSDYDEVRSWLSPEEYTRLSPNEKYQLALDRYKKRKRSDWEAGIEYERYVGYKYEQQGFRVKYFGATNGLEDMGRDLIAEKGNRVYVIQCKRWSKEKLIHEKHIFQLYGSTILLSLSEKNKSVVGVFVTTARLSDLAKKCADHLHIEVCENYPLNDYPLIKCNISKEHSKIYHLPFDQQYDRVRIIPSSGEFYAHTIAEAEEAGFRRAKRWISET